MALGHGHAGWRDAVERQSRKLTHVSNLYHTLPALELAKDLVESTRHFDRVFFCNSGTEANEAALKFARRWALARPRCPARTVSFKGSFHGRSMGALSLTHKPAIRTPFEPLLQGMEFSEFNDASAAEELIARVKPCAVWVEPIQGEGGVNVATPEFMQVRPCPATPQPPRRART